MWNPICCSALILANLPSLPLLRFPLSVLNTQTIDAQNTDDAVLFSQDFTRPLSSTLFCLLTSILNANGIFCTSFPDPVRLLVIYSSI